ncbi:tyrosine 3-monooxygenase/tryptophan 5-monooxygenase activation protein [Fusarium oxysporum Fo47]|uniref:Tyrosine 3-monooxygenase/tryptophan 5-monooxygenase activation protein n=1 Tax=Fusarium oxysporum Fo47 TaxID=660027 RepID=W9JAI0_FUSOX|nr:tyrosine 3-monooxygenase/tryptophan 5-monooxygenase activation protein [Fusarium oxysporum Fo47]EWZ29063.1 tyrosine 3-monooxygenase/tryptophan 5-monooxygenase activation protein [Fusarium oxysporum Fo47]
MNELEKLYEDLLEILAERLIPITITGMSMVFYYKMKGDIGRYLVEFGSSENNNAINLAQDAYKKVIDDAIAEVVFLSEECLHDSAIVMQRPVIGMVWYGLVWGVKPNHTRCLHNNRYGITGKTNNTIKDAKTFKNDVEKL